MKQYEGYIIVRWKEYGQDRLSEVTAHLFGDERGWAGTLENRLGNPVPDGGVELTARFEDGRQGRAKVVSVVRESRVEVGQGLFRDFIRTPLTVRIAGQGPAPFG